MDRHTSTSLSSWCSQDLRCSTQQSQFKAALWRYVTGALVPDISKKHSAVILSGQAEQDNIANREVWQYTGSVLMVCNWKEGWSSQVWKWPVCVRCWSPSGPQQGSWCVQILQSGVFLPQFRFHIKYCISEQKTLSLLPGIMCSNAANASLYHLCHIGVTVGINSIHWNISVWDTNISCQLQANFTLWKFTWRKMGWG